MDASGQPRKPWLVPEMASTADHGQVHAQPAALRVHGDDVGVGVVAGIHRLLLQHARERPELVAQRRRTLELQARGRGMHALLDVGEHGLAVATQEAQCIGHVGRVLTGADQARARCGASVDLVQHARP